MRRLLSNMEPSLVALYKMDSKNVPILDQGPRGQANGCSRKGQGATADVFKIKAILNPKMKARKGYTDWLKRPNDVIRYESFGVSSLAWSE